MGVSLRERERESVYVVCVCVTLRERVGLCACARERKRKRKICRTPPTKILFRKKISIVEKNISFAVKFFPD